LSFTTKRHFIADNLINNLKESNLQRVLASGTLVKEGACLYEQNYAVNTILI
jgi:hypothetical protein